jgi:hypothetical protein
MMLLNFLWGYVQPIHTKLEISSVENAFKKTNLLNILA